MEEFNLQETQITRVSPSIYKHFQKIPCICMHGISLRLQIPHPTVHFFWGVIDEIERHGPVMFVRNKRYRGIILPIINDRN